MNAYEHALRANPNSIPAMNAISLILRTREEFHKAVEFLQAILKIDERNGEVWGSLGTYMYTCKIVTLLHSTDQHTQVTAI